MSASISLTSIDFEKDTKFKIENINPGKFIIEKGIEMKQGTTNHTRTPTHWEIIVFVTF